MRRLLRIVVALALVGAVCFNAAPASSGTLDFGPPGQPGISEFAPVTLNGGPTIPASSITKDAPTVAPAGGESMTGVAGHATTGNLSMPTPPPTIKMSPTIARPRPPTTFATPKSKITPTATHETQTPVAMPPRRSSQSRSSLRSTF